LTFIATKSMPTVACLPASTAIFNFVPTPSAEETSTGSRNLSLPMRKRLPKPPMSAMTSGRKERLTSVFIFPLKTDALSISTPACL